MITSNKHDLPDTIVRALKKQDQLYNAGEVDSSVTSLIQPARISLLRKLHYNELERDVADSVWALLGSGIHHILELGATPDMIVEERLFMDIDGWKISGAVDVQQVRMNKIDITDYKITSVYSVTKNDGAKPEWEAQLNLHALLVEANKPMKVKSLHIMVVLRDWQSEKAKGDPFYPQAPIMMIPVPIWPKKKQLSYARERIASHRQAKFDHALGNELEECTAEDRWVRGDKWVVIKKGGKRALKTFDNDREAANLLEEKGNEFEIQYRPGKSLRCGYCQVSQFCSQFQRMENNNDSDPVSDEADGA
jgi:hypothetical protein